jgi:hypothetical protein
VFCNHKKAMKTYTYNEYTVRKRTAHSLTHPERDVILSKHQSIGNARKAMTADSYIFNEQYGFVALPEHFGSLTPEGEALQNLEIREARNAN